MPTSNDQVEGRMVKPKGNKASAEWGKAWTTEKKFAGVGIFFSLAVAALVFFTSGGLEPNGSVGIWSVAATVLMAGLNLTTAVSLLLAVKRNEETVVLASVNVRHIIVLEIERTELYLQERKRPKASDRSVISTDGFDEVRRLEQHLEVLRNMLSLS